MKSELQRLSLGGRGVPWPTGVMFLALSTRRERVSLRRGTQEGQGTPLPPYRNGRHPNRSLQYPVPMADAAQSQPVAPRLASVREQLSLLSDYL